MTSLKISEIAVSNSNWKIEDIARLFANNVIYLSDRIDRPSRDWDIIRKSRFIESLNLGLPSPQLVLAADLSERNIFSVVDGKQRLLAISQFYNGDFALTGLEIWKELEGHTYDSIASNPYLSQAIYNLDASSVRVAIVRNWQDESLLLDLRSRLKINPNDER
jgi:hypothetical protein